MTDSGILIVDDEPEVVDTYRQHLADTYTVRTAQSGEEALALLDDTIDIVLLDRRMPGMSGDEVLERVRERSIDCRVVMVTAVDPDIDIVTMEFDEYLVKPVSGDDLRETVERLRRRTQLDAQIQRIVELGSKLATLEAKLEYEQLEQSERYDELREEFNRLREDTKLDDIDDPYLEATVENIEALLPDRL
ncbi:response regulator [Halovenus sp. WSH3]|uniref:Response regulator n=1 Tax=Halovenus carboxidivorans TaxID=2692199 RepID=A0A6B0T637_9EURY|nr:response regulator [Halovenus carboxidivorans]MXR50742.1 response regulator [Halovenus carboxidivorans]